MGTRYLADSNVLIDLLEGRLPLKGKQLVFEVLDQGELIVSVVTEIEVLGFQAPDDYLQKVQRLTDAAEVIPLADATTIREAIAIRRTVRLKLPDAVIAATAKVRGLTLLSRNEKDFNRVEGLTVLNLHTL